MNVTRITAKTGGDEIFEKLIDSLVHDGYALTGPRLAFVEKPVGVEVIFRLVFCRELGVERAAVRRTKTLLALRPVLWLRHLRFEKLAEEDASFIENRPIPLASDYVGVLAGLERTDMRFDNIELDRSLQQFLDVVRLAEQALNEIWGTLERAEASMRLALNRQDAVLGNAFGDERKLKLLTQLIHAPQ
jgi:hypothetical protein